MIKENINITFTGGETIFEGEGQIIVPSQVMTATKQNEEVDLEKAPNVLIKLKDEAARGVRSLSSEYKKIKAEFELGDKTYTMNVSLIDSSEDYAVLQYCDGLTSEEVKHTFEFNNNEYATSWDMGPDTRTSAEFCLLYNGEEIELSNATFSSMEHNNYEFVTGKYGKIYPKTSFPEMAKGEFVDTFTATYNGMTATATVTLTLSDTAADYITFETSQGTFVVWDSNGGKTDTVIYAAQDMSPDGVTMVTGTWRYYIQGQELVDRDSIQSDGGQPFDAEGIKNVDLAPWPKDDGIYNVTGDIGYRTSDGETWVKITDSLTINVQRTVTPESE